MYTVYGLFLIPENRMIYIGATTRNPYVALAEYCTTNDKIKEIVTKYGFDAIRIDILDTNVENYNIACEMKESYIDQYGEDNELINIAYGSHSMAGTSIESQRDHYNNTLRIWQQEHGSWCKGKKMSDEFRRKASEAKKGKVSEKQLKQLREHPPTAIPVFCTETNIKYQSAAQAGRALNLDSSSIIKCCKGKCSNTKGYHFQYPDPDKVILEYGKCPWDIQI